MQPYTSILCKVILHLRRCGSIKPSLTMSTYTSNNMGDFLHTYLFFKHAFDTRFNFLLNYTDLLAGMNDDFFLTIYFRT